MVSVINAAVARLLYNFSPEMKITMLSQNDNVTYIHIGGSVPVSRLSYSLGIGTRSGKGIRAQGQPVLQSNICGAGFLSTFFEYLHIN